jgi:hypothetical protein
LVSFARTERPPVPTDQSTSAAHAAGRCGGGRSCTLAGQCRGNGLRRRGGSCSRPFVNLAQRVTDFDASGSHLCPRLALLVSVDPPRVKVGFHPTDAGALFHVLPLALICSAHRCAIPSTLACW